MWKEINVHAKKVWNKSVTHTYKPLCKRSVLSVIYGNIQLSLMADWNNLSWIICSFPNCNENLYGEKKKGQTQTLFSRVKEYLNSFTVNPLLHYGPYLLWTLSSIVDRLLWTFFTLDLVLYWWPSLLLSTLPITMWIILYCLLYPLLWTLYCLLCPLLKSVSFTFFYLPSPFHYCGCSFTVNSLL